MEIRDKKGMYLIKVDIEKRIVYETMESENEWIAEDCERLHNEYVNKIVPIFNGDNWVKCCDLRKYKTSNITDTIASHIEWSTKNGYVKAVIVVSSVIVKLQIEKTIVGTPLELKVVTNLEEANYWLSKQEF